MAAVTQMMEGWGLHYVMWYVWSDILEVNFNIFVLLVTLVSDK